MKTAGLVAIFLLLQGLETEVTTGRGYGSVTQKVHSSFVLGKAEKSSII
jgi:hypothetical protein